MAHGDWYRTYFREPYNEFYADYLLSPHVTGEEAEFARRALGFGNDDRVLDCPCGYGRHMEWHWPALPGIVGVDLERDCLKRAVESLPGGRFIQGDMRALPFRSGQFDAVVNLFNSFGYFSHEENRAVVREFSRVLKPGGRLMIDVANPTPLVDVIEEQPRTRQSVGDLLVTEDWSYDPETAVLANRTQFEHGSKRTDRSYDVILYDADRLTEMLDRAALGVERIYGEFTGEAFDPAESTRIIVVARKR
ncbi:class I SAM-dependent methyltransferase [Candidatus Sumerlaeota bacterium]|nr:class I SAM-dependent methyltransferase [Candidatus Sumerlaeota bacterium]